MKNNFEISQIANSGLDVVEAINDLSVFEIVYFPTRLLNLSLSNEAYQERDQQDFDYNNDYKVEFKLNSDVVLSKAMFKLLVNSVDKNCFSGVSVKKNMFIRVRDIDAIYEISKKTSKDGNEKRKEILKNRLDGEYKEKFSNGKVWNKGGI